MMQIAPSGFRNPALNMWTKLPVLLVIVLCCCLCGGTSDGFAKLSEGVLLFSIRSVTPHPQAAQPTSNVRLLLAIS